MQGRGGYAATGSRLEGSRRRAAKHRGIIRQHATWLRVAVYKAAGDGLHCNNGVHRSRAGCRAVGQRAARQRA